MTSQHLTPCDQCPWRKTSAPGWLGSSTPLQFLAQAESEIRMPCHCAISYEDPNWKNQVEQAPRCAGHATYLRNRCKSPRDPGLSAFVRQVTANTQEVFTHAVDFVAHHQGDVSRVPMVVLGVDDGEP
jgi:hypothetical protein